MRLAFTTLGCPRWELPVIVERAVAYGFQGIDFRGYLGRMQVYDDDIFGRDIDDTANRIADAGLELSCFSSGAGLMPTPHKPVAQSIEELRRYAALCPRFGTRYIRVFGLPIGQRSWPEAIDEAAGTLAAMAAIAADHGARVLLETHDAWVHAPHIQALMEAVDSPQVGVLWDIHHPWRHGETPAETWAQLAPWIVNTHWKDAKLPDHELCLMGEGELPLAECHALLAEAGHDGWYTLEWEKGHHPELAEPEIAFPAFVRVMQALAAEVAR